MPQFTKKLVRLFASDLERLELYYPAFSISAVIRELVHRHVQAKDAELLAKVQQKEQEHGAETDPGATEPIG